ncbi:MAG: adenine phosphoribosyltransferase, partial [Bacteroidota bacterium]
MASSLSDRLRQTIREVPDFPIPGILFKDIAPVFLDPDLMQDCVEGLASPWRTSSPTKVLGIESRGFLFGPQLATSLGAGFVMIRKKGKLPPETIEVSYDLEYGQATLESVKGSLEPGDRVIIHDDLLATGGTAAAAAQLAQKLGAEVVGFSFIAALSF